MFGNNPDTPDGVRGSVSAQKVFGPFTTAHTTENVTLPPNTETLAIIQEGVAPNDVVTVTGSASGFEYPVTRVETQNGLALFPTFLAMVWPALDPIVTVGWGRGPTNTWAVVADLGVRTVYDLAIGGSLIASGQLTPVTGLLVDGSDGTFAHPLLTDSSGRLEVVEAYPASGNATVGNFSFTGNGTLGTVGGGGIKVWDAALQNSSGVAAGGRVNMGGLTGAVLVGVPSNSGDQTDHFTSSRGMFFAAGTLISGSVTAAGATFLFTMNYDQL